MNPETHNAIKPKAVIYCRVSDPSQVTEGNSLVTQEKLCREYAFKQGYEIASAFIEKGKSAKTKDRKELNELLAYCSNRNNNISFVVVYKIDRFARNIDDYSYLRIRLKRYGILLKSTTEFFGDNPAGKFMENIIANVAQFDNDVRTERAVNGSREAMREGRYAWSAPWGYMHTRIAGKGTIEPNQNAPIVRQIFEEVAKNEYPVEEIRKRMLHSGFTNLKGKPISRSQFYRLLKNEVYAGWIIKFGERNKGLFQPIVPETLFEQVQLVLKHRTRKNYSYQTKHPDFPLRRFVSHPNGLKLTGAWSQGKIKKYPYYRYIAKMMNFPKEALEAQFKSFMDHYSLNESHFEALKKKLRDTLSKGVKYRLKDREKVQLQVRQLKEKQSLLIEKNIEGIISNEILRDQLDRIDKELLNLNSRLYIEPQYDVNYEELVENAKELLTNPSKVWERANNENKLRLQVFEFPQGVMYDGSIFRTPEICRLFKVKDIFLHEKSHRAGVKKKVFKNIPDIAILPSINGDKVTLPNKDNPTTKKYWEEIGKQLIEVNEILKEKPL